MREVTVVTVTVINRRAPRHTNIQRATLSRQLPEPKGGLQDLSRPRCGKTFNPFKPIFKQILDVNVMPKHVKTCQIHVKAAAR